MRFPKLAGGAALLVAVSLIGGTLIGSVFAAPSSRGTSTHSNGTADAHGGPWLAGGGEYCDVFLDTLASELGASREEMLAAGQAAAKAAVDAAVEAGDLDEERAVELKERIDAIEEAQCGGLLRGIGHPFARGFAHGFVRADVLDAAADALGIESSELFQKMVDGDSLEDVAEDVGTSYQDVKGEVLAELDSDLQAAVEEGMAQERADAIHDRIAEWLDDGGEPLTRRFHERMPVPDGPFPIN
jgi:hypothetical protein